jgi:hypothetical protein
MSSFNKKIPKKRYAEDRRQLQRNELERTYELMQNKSSDSTLMSKNSQMKT